MKDPKMDEECEKRLSELFPCMHDYLDHYAKTKDSEIALIEYDTGEMVTWKDFATKSKAFAAKLLSLGIKKGDIVATSLPLLKEHIFLMYACYRIGAIYTPLDLRLKTQEINRNFEKINPKIYFFLGKTEMVDFRPMIAEVMKNHPECKYWVQFQKDEDLIMDGAIGIGEFAKGIKGTYINGKNSTKPGNLVKFLTIACFHVNLIPEISTVCSPKSFFPIVAENTFSNTIKYAEKIISVPKA